MKKQKITSLQVVGRRWFQKSYGNTYCAVKVYIDGELVISAGPMYGYEDYFEQRAGELLYEKKLLPYMKRYSYGGHEHLNTYCRRKGIRYVRDVADVKRERDLKDFVS